MAHKGKNKIIIKNWAEMYAKCITNKHNCGRSNVFSDPGIYFEKKSFSIADCVYSLGEKVVAGFSCCYFSFYK